MRYQWGTEIDLEARKEAPRMSEGCIKYMKANVGCEVMSWPSVALRVASDQ